MSHYSDTEEQLPPKDSGLRKRKLWDPETESITSEIKELLEDDVNSLVSDWAAVVLKTCDGCYVLGGRGVHWLPLAFYTRG